MTAKEKRPLLVVDDEVNILHSLYDLLRLDYTVYTAQSGPEAKINISPRSGLRRLGGIEWGN